MMPLDFDDVGRWDLQRGTSIHQVPVVTLCQRQGLAYLGHQAIREDHRVPKQPRQT